MEILFNAITNEYLLLTLVLIVIGVMLNNWQNPPLHRDFQFIILSIVGIGLGLSSIGMNIQVALYSFCVSGLVFFKDILIEEITLIIKLSKKKEEK